MAQLTLGELLDAFCRRYDFDIKGLPAETKAQFLVRMRKEWSMREARDQIRSERSGNIDSQLDIDVGTVSL